MQRTRYGSVHFLFSIRKMCNFSRTLYNRQLIEFERIPIEFVARFMRFYQNCVKVISFSMAAKHLLLISSYRWCLRDLRVQCLELYTACILLQYHRHKAFHFPGKFHFLVKTITEVSQTRSSLLKFSVQYSKRGYVLWNLSTVCGPHHHDPRFIYLVDFQVFFNRSSISDPRFSLPDRPSSILASGFPVNLEVLLIKIVIFFDH